MKRLVAGSAGLVAAIMAVNAGNYGLNLLLANVLDPSMFGDASLLVTILLITGVLAATIQLATSIAILRSPEERNGLVDVMRLFTNRVGWIGGLLLVVVSPLATTQLQVENSWALLVMAAGFPLHLQLAVERGRLQGDLALGRLAMTFLCEGAARIVATVVVLAIVPNVGALAIALNLGFVGGYLVCRPQRGLRSWLDLTRPDSLPPLGAVGTAVVAATLLTNLDVLAAKGVFEPAEAGAFAALALGGRVVFFASWTLQQALLPLVLAENGNVSARTRRRAFLGGNALVCAALVAVGWLWADVWVKLAFGASYSEIAEFVGPYAFGTGLISVAASFAVVHSAENNERTGRILLAGSLAVTAVITTAGDSLASFVDTRLTALLALSVIIAIASHVSSRLPKRLAQNCRSTHQGALS